MEACYKILGIAEGATIEEAKAAYRKMIKTWHPDRYTQNAEVQKEAEEKTKAANIAYEQFIELENTPKIQTSYQHQAANYQWEAFVKEQKNKARQPAPQVKNSVFKNAASLASTAILLFVFAVSLMTVQNIQNAHADEFSANDIPVYTFADDTAEAPLVDFRKNISPMASTNLTKAAGGSVFRVNL